MTFINFPEQCFNGLETVDSLQLRECQAVQTNAGFLFKNRKEPFFNKPQKIEKPEKDRYIPFRTSGFWRKTKSK